MYMHMYKPIHAYIHAWMQRRDLLVAQLLPCPGARYDLTIMESALKELGLCNKPKEQSNKYLLFLHSFFNQLPIFLHCGFLKQVEAIKH